MASQSRFAVFLCQGGKRGEQSLEFKRLRWTAEAGGHRVMEITQACGQEGAATVARLARENGLDSFILGACPLAAQGGPLPGELARAGLMPDMALHLDLCQKPQGATGECQVATGGQQALSQALVAELARPASQSVELAVARRVLVLGDGLLALSAAKMLLAAGHPVTLLTPGRRLAPPEPLLGAGANREAADLARELEGAEALEVIPRGHLLRLAGPAGNFQASLLDGQGQRLTRQVGAVLVTQAPPSRLNLGAEAPPAGPRIISLAELMGWLSSPEHFRKKLPVAGAPRVGLAVGLDRQASPLNLRAACLAGRQLVNELGAEATLFTSQAKMAAPDLEELTQAVRGEGVAFVKFTGSRPQISPLEDGLGIAYHEEILDRQFCQVLDLLAVDEVSAPDDAWRALAQALGLEVSADGGLQPDQVSALPTGSQRAGVLLAGPAAGAWDLAAGLDQISQALWRVRRLLGGGTVTVPAGRVQVDRKRCTICLTCLRVCPQQAMGRLDRRPVSNPLACTACGTCASECPMEAIQLLGDDDQRYLGEVAAAVTKSPSGLQSSLERELLVFACANSAGAALDAARLEGQAWPEGVRLVRVPCAGKIDPDYVLRAFLEGLDGVLILGCFQDACHSLTGSTWAGYRAEHLANLLAEAGCDPRRLISAGVAPNMQGVVMDLLRQALASLEELGPNPLKTEARVREFLSRFTVRIDETYAITG